MVQPHQGTSLGPEMEGRLTQAASWLDPEDVTPSEISWSREDKEHTTPRTCGPRRHVTETGRRGGRRALAGLHGGMLTFNGESASVLQDEKMLWVRRTGARRCECVERPDLCAQTAKVMVSRCVFHSLKMQQKADLFTDLRSLVCRHMRNANRGGVNPFPNLHQRAGPWRGAGWGAASTPPEKPSACGAAALRTSLSAAKGRGETGRTHPRRDDRDRQVAAVQEEGQHQEVDVAPVAGQQDHRVLLDGSLQLQGKGQAQRSRPPPRARTRTRTRQRPREAGRPGTEPVSGRAPPWMSADTLAGAVCAPPHPAGPEP